MSASSKKKLRKEQEAAKLTERQLNAQKETKKVSLYTASFVVVMTVILVLAVTIGVIQTINSSGIREKNTVALTVGDHEISNAEMNYFFMDAVNNFYSNYGSYAALFGLDTSVPLNEQVVNEETGATWADDFMTSATESAKAVYALADAAEAAGFSLTGDELATIKANVDSVDDFALLYGYSDGESYLKAMYGNGATTESFLAYCELTSLANAYANHYSQSLTYEDADLRAVDGEDFGAYSSYSYNTYYLGTSKFLQGGTTDEEGNTTYTDDERAAAAEAAEAAAKALAEGQYATISELDAAIAALDVNKDTSAASSTYANTLHSSVSSTYADWVSDPSRKAGDITFVESASTTTNEDGTETTTVNGYYVVYFVGSTDNTFALKNVRHILVSFEGGTTDSTTGAVTYSDEEMAAAKTSAEAILAEWKAGEATEDSFAALANEKSSDGDGTTGGLYENIYPGQMVSTFENWCYDSSRKPGDTGIVESTYGYHVMYFSADAELNYRDYLISTDLRDADYQEWYNALVEAMTVTEGDTSYVRTDLVMNAA